MATPSEKLAQSLEMLRILQQQGCVAIRSADLSRTHRQRLCANGFLREVMKGWYIPSRPDETAGESTAWYACFWSFIASYLQERFAQDWCLSPEQSLLLHAGNRTVPSQLIIRSSKARNQRTVLLFDTSILEVRAALPEKNETEEKDGVRLFSLPAALVACSPTLFRLHPTDTRTALAMIRDASDVLHILLNGGHTVVAGRLAGAFRNIGRDRIADDILAAMRSADYNSHEQDPFEDGTPARLPLPETSPYVTRIRLMWQVMRETVLKHFPESPGLPGDGEAYLKQVTELYATDAYHSLSIEGYHVNPDLIERVRSGNWRPDTRRSDRDIQDALAARGYWEAFQEVKKSLESILKGDNPGAVLRDQHGLWYRNLFAPQVVAGILKPADLAGYRNDQVYIRRSMHVPPAKAALRDLMPAFFDLLEEETHAAVRAVLGHFFFVYIHPYMDGNGRIGRFLMNAMLASGGYSWTIIPVETRDHYFTALEEASGQQNIARLSFFLAGLVKRGLGVST